MPRIMIARNNELFRYSMFIIPGIHYSVPSLTWRDAALASCGEKDFAVARSGTGAAIACPCQVKGGSIYGQWTTSSLRVGIGRN